MRDDTRRAYLALKSECSFRSGAIGGAPANGRSWIRLKSKRVSTCSSMLHLNSRCMKLPEFVAR